MAKLGHDWIQQGIQQGRSEEALRLTLRSLHRRIGIFPALQEAQVRSLSVEQRELLSDALWDFSTAKDLEHWLKLQAPQGK